MGKKGRQLAAHSSQSAHSFLCGIVRHSQSIKIIFLCAQRAQDIIKCGRLCPSLCVVSASLLSLSSSCTPNGVNGVLDDSSFCGAAEFVLVLKGAFHLVFLLYLRRSGEEKKSKEVQI
eukprot:scaffold7160_cov156-Ochromonas_danica.AAC.7